MEAMITYLEMTSPDQLVPGREVTGLALERVERDRPDLPAVQTRIGAPYGWRAARLSAEEWERKLATDPFDYYLIRHEGEIAGMLAVHPQDGGDVEIETFGLVPEFVGKGLGGHALTLCVRQAWATTPRDGGPARRVWLHTSSDDNPAALPNYRARGFRPYRTEIEAVRPDRTPA
ncbi:GNAT family N-acetyltransferase [Nonomuraea sp. SMC257]|uniref:GNAT family N-acetyltransferase n=1 Tax=Nonomuraea montanisoli TaxID=2741721 RepID=A0A7Y6I5H9_9ACTN|nr:GNAT family N-acetyltransferase [Nonomuraea montanisoli]NUW31961.1 GNAT family N-acetyltransferase [Nonomuraea montanisoli]